MRGGQTGIAGDGKIAAPVYPEDAERRYPDCRYSCYRLAPDRLIAGKNKVGIRGVIGQRP